LPPVNRRTCRAVPPITATNREKWSEKSNALFPGCYNAR
jgi:hypothetical protein